MKPYRRLFKEEKLKMTYTQSKTNSMPEKTADILVKMIKNKYHYIENPHKEFYEKKYKDAFDHKGYDTYIVIGHIDEKFYKETNPNITIKNFNVGIS